MLVMNGIWYPLVQQGPIKVQETRECAKNTFNQGIRFNKASLKSFILDLSKQHQVCS